MCGGVVNGIEFQARATVHWQILVDQVVDKSERFASFKVTTRAEKRTTATSTDTVVASKTCDFTEQFNKDWANATGLTCQAPATRFDPAAWWSSDTAVTYDIEDDSKGPTTWQLTGSSLVH
ncbi:hypothetical protein OG883_23370 [Streptomyces sp. NBC_01142]|uniref:hypothetical protein n=1 Tax=Streptomyces sp. NBC_01142 TaxID=2975865 RepID=UPI0022529B83|nr:hypothetical protein [Streptomyces sp. NBC_01142]MCX4822785.1 hypothetical protein [Streptomyces sp. NBC_01142]